MRGPADTGHATTDDRLAHAIGQAILVADGRSPLDPGAAEDQLEIVVRAAEAERVARELLHQAAGAARAGGQSWTAVGARLGMSRQAVQQRFAFRDSDPAPHSGYTPSTAPHYRWLGPVSAFVELPELQRAGRLGWTPWAPGCCDTGSCRPTPSGSTAGSCGPARCGAIRTRVGNSAAGPFPGST